MTLNIQPITLTGRIIRLEPLTEAHVPDLTAAGQDESIWRFMRYGIIRTEEQMTGLVHELLSRQAQGTDLVFATIHLAEGRAIGMTRYLEIQPANRGLEIGGTWLDIAHQKTLVNTESKYLLLRHAFEDLGCIRVQIKTDVRNEHSQRAIERLGAVREGLLRDHIILPDGTIRSSQIYSILAGEWPAVKERLEGRLQQRW